MIDVISYRELTDEVRKYIKDANVFDIAKAAKPFREEILEEATEITWEMWDEIFPLGGIDPEKTKEDLEKGQVIFVLKEKGTPIASRSKSPFDGTILTEANVRETAEKFLDVFRTDHMKRRLTDIVVDALVEKKI